MAASISQLIDLSGKNALVTGAAQGLGRAISLRLHEAGASLVLFDSNHDELHKLSDQLHHFRPGSSYAVCGDVTKAADVEQAITAAKDQFGGVDILVNNAGVYPIKYFSEMTEEDFRFVIDVNLMGAFLFTKAVATFWRESGRGGKIINITSVDALHPSANGHVHYDAAKHAVWGFTQSTALELTKDGITVNAVAPGNMSTPGMDQRIEHLARHNHQDQQSQKQDDISRIPMGRYGDPDEVARVVLFLASDLASYMTGSQIVVDGGKLLS